MPLSKILLAGRYLLSTLSGLYRAVRAHENDNIVDDAIRAYYARRLSPLEDVRIDTIRLLRNSLIRNTDQIPIKEYGTGSSIISKAATTERVSDVCLYMSKSHNDGLFLYQLIKTLKPIHLVELGTCLGISASYIGSALVQNQSGRLVTFEGSPARAEIAIQTIKTLGIDSTARLIEGRFQDTLENHLQYTEYIDFAFIDGHHDGDAAIGYFNQLLPKFRNGGIMVFDDIFWSAGMNRAWHAIKKSGAVVDSFVFKGMGVIEVS